MTTAVGPRDANSLGMQPWRLPGAKSLAWPVIGIAVVLALHLAVALGRAVNWDEFWHYNLVRSLAEGTLKLPLQTLFTRFFTWVLALPASGIDHIVVIRLTMFGCLLAICASIYLMALRFAAKSAALLCVLLYITAGYVLHHGTSFRFDPMAGALLMISLTIMLRSRMQWWEIVLASATAALATVITIKTVLYAPAFAGVFWLRWQEAKDGKAALLRLAAMIIAAVPLTAMIYAFHSQGLGDAAVTGANAQLTLHNSLHKMFGFGDLPYYHVIWMSATTAPIFAACIVLTPVLLIRARSSLGTAEKVALAGLWLPICTLAIYHNTAPYFYVYILPPVAVACGLAVHALSERYGTTAIAGLLVLSAAGIWLYDDHSGTQDKQRQLLAAADQIFPRPVNYFDFPGMSDRHHKVNAFMTPWGTENYLKGDMPSLRATMESVPVPLVIDNDPMFAEALHGRPGPGFLPQDAAALHDNYIPYWGPFWVAGKMIRAGAGESPTEVLVPGPYTVRGGSALIDGKAYQQNAVVKLARGHHRLGSLGNRDVRLVWGDPLREPDFPAPEPPYWTDF